MFDYNYYIIIIQSLTMAAQTNISNNNIIIIKVTKRNKLHFLSGFKMDYNIFKDISICNNKIQYLCINITYFMLIHNSKCTYVAI